MKTITALFLLLTFFIVCLAQGPPSDRQQFIRVEAPVIALAHVRVIDGTGAAPREDQTIVISSGKIQSIAPSTNATLPTGAQVLDLNGYTVLPGLVGSLYLVLGVTTIRTTGRVVPYTDLEIKKLIDGGRMIGPKMHITAPYLEGRGSFTPVMHELTGPDDARRMVNFWPEQGATSFKAYMNAAISDIEKVEIVFKDGVGYDSEKLIQSVQGLVGIR